MNGLSEIAILLAGLGLNAALLAARAARPLALAQAMDETKTFTIRLAVVAEGKATIVAIAVFNQRTGILYDVYPGGQVPEAAEGDLLNITAGMRNDGQDDDMWARLTDDLGVVLGEWAGFRAAGAAFPCDAFNVSMPARDYVILLEAGHVE